MFALRISMLKEKLFFVHFNCKKKTFLFFWFLLLSFSVIFQRLETKNKPINMKINDWRWFVSFFFQEKLSVKRNLLITFCNPLILNQTLENLTIYNFNISRPRKKSYFTAKKKNFAKKVWRQYASKCYEPWNFSWSLISLEQLFTVSKTSVRR